MLSPLLLLRWISRHSQKASTLVAMSIACWLIAPRPARADAGGDKAAAEALFEEGRRQLAAGAYVEACEKFQASQQLDPGIGTLLYLGDCYEKTGRTASAWASFREAASLAEAQGHHKRLRIAQARTNALEPRLAKLLIEVAPSNLALDGFKVIKNGAVVPSPTFGVEVPLDPGEYTLAAAAPGHASYQTTVNLSRGTVRELIPTLSPTQGKPNPVATAQSQRPARPISSARRRLPEADTQVMPGTRMLGLALGGAGVVGLAVGGVLGALALDKNADSETLCRPDDPTRCTSRGVELRDEARRYANWSTVGFCSGGALLASGVVLWLTAPAASRQISVMAGASPSSARVSIGGAF